MDISNSTVLSGASCTPHSSHLVPECLSLRICPRWLYEETPATVRSKYLFFVDLIISPHGTSECHLHYMISQHTVQVSQKTIARRCFSPQCFVGDELFGIARRVQGCRISMLCNVRLSSSSTRWKTRQGKDSFARKAKLEGLKSRAAFKLLEVCRLSKSWKKSNH